MLSSGGNVLSRIFSTRKQKRKMILRRGNNKIQQKTRTTEVLLGKTRRIEKANAMHATEINARGEAV